MKIVSFSDHQPKKNVEIVDLLKTLLLRAEAGEFSGIAVVADAGGAIETAYFFPVQATAIGATLLLHRDVLNDVSAVD